MILKAGIKNVSSEDKIRLRDQILEVLNNDIDLNTVKKVMTLSCRLYPNDIKMV